MPSDVVRIDIGVDPQRLVDEHPPGTAFVFASGVHRNASITRLKDGNQFYGDPGAVLDGTGATTFAIVAYDEPAVHDVVIRGLTFEAYGPPSQLAPIGGGRAIGWRIEYNEIRESSAAGIQVGDESIAKGNWVHHNRQLGIKTGNPTNGVHIVDNEVSFNNYRDEFDYSFEAGGMKFVNSVDLVVEGNYVHGNHGTGIWTDINNVGSQIRRNVVEDNLGPGIFHEISYAAVISGNVVSRNGFGFYRGGILIASSGGVEVTANAVVDNDGGIILIQEDRGSGRLGEYRVEDVTVSDNLVVYSEGATGVLDQIGDGGVFTRNITFSGNSYHVSALSEPFEWDGDTISTDEWLTVHEND